MGMQHLAGKKNKWDLYIFHPERQKLENKGSYETVNRILRFVYLHVLDRELTVKLR